MLFNKNIEPSCSYCKHGRKISETEMICRKHGIVSRASHCGKFFYDPFKRQPPEPVTLNTEKFSPEDFEL